MWNYKCLSDLLNSNDLDLKHLINYYISYISIFYCINIELDEVLQDKVDDLVSHINILIEGE